MKSLYGVGLASKKYPSVKRSPDRKTIARSSQLKIKADISKGISIFVLGTSKNITKGITKDLMEFIKEGN